MEPITHGGITAIRTNSEVALNGHCVLITIRSVRVKAVSQVYCEVKSEYSFFLSITPKLCLPV